MKILHKFSQNLWNKRRRVHVTLLILLLFQPLAQAQKFTDTLSTLFKINKEATKSFKFLDLKISKSSQLKTDQFNYYINKDYLLSVLFRLPQPISEVLGHKKCILLELLTSKLFNSHEVIILDQENKLTKTISQVKALSSLAIPQIYQSQCPNLNKKITSNLKNLSFIIKKDYLKPRTNFFQCKQDLDSFSQSPQFINALLISKKIRENRKLKNMIIQSENLKRDELQKLLSFYDHFISKKTACNAQKTLNISKENYSNTKKNFILPICKDKFNDQKSIETCIENFSSLKKTCMEAFSKNKNQLFPHQSCKESLENLSLVKNISPPSQLKFYGESLKQAFRIFSSVTLIQTNINPTFENFLNFLEKEGELDLFNSSFCYQHKFLKTRKCEKTFFSQSKHYLSINNQVEKALKRQKIIPNSMSCRFLDEESQISLTKIDSGCRISYLKQRCYLNYCPFNVFINGKLLKLKFEVSQNFNFAFQNFSNKNDFKYFIHVLKRAFKLKVLKVTNSTQVKKYLKNKKSIIFGSVCIEDILNKRLTRRSFSQCNPVLITVNGSRGNDIIVQMSIEDNHFLRKFEWDQLKSSIENFSKSNNINWSLHALTI